MCYLYKRLFEAKRHFKRYFRVSKSGNILVHYILFAMEENGIHRRSKPADPSMASNPQRFGPPTGMPHRHHRQEEEAPHLHIGGNKNKE
jgi:hypothetical protein